MLSIDNPVRLDKLSAHKTPEGMLPTGYYLKGFLLELPTVGQTLRVERYERAAQKPDEVTPVKCLGLYVSSPVKSIVEHEDGSVTAYTQNSAWRITPLDEPAPEVVTIRVVGVGLDTI